VSSVSRKAGGLHESVRRLAQSLDDEPSTEVNVIGMSDEHTREDEGRWRPLPTHVFPVVGPQQYGYAPGLKKKLLQLDADILLTHGLWMYPTVASLSWHRRTQRPFIIHPHGMLDPWAVKNSKWKKRVASICYENSSLEKASCIRALCLSEAESIRSYGLTNPICVIPNGIDLPPEGITHDPPPWVGKVEPGAKILLYLGRIHPKKGLVNLLRAWRALQEDGSSVSNGWALAVAGWDQNGHEQELSMLANQLGTRGVHFLGPQFGKAKAAAYAHANAFVLPSFSEGLPMVVLEAWAHRLPVVMTPECNLPEGFQAQAAIRTEPEACSLAQGLKELFAMTDAERQLMGSRGRALVAERFSWPTIAADMNDVCKWLLGQGSQPSCILS
jgi:glycosyltransferase involved in cell wall biosynthesis